MAAAKKAEKVTKEAVAEKAAEVAATAAAEPVAEAAPAEEAPKRRGRKPGSKNKSTLAKEAAAAKEADKKTATKAAGKKVAHTAIIEFGGNQFNVDDIVARAEADFKANNKRKTFSDLKVYIKPEEYKAYYVVKTGRSESAGSVDM